ncbi:hypothetical protein [Stenotrophomonas indicatrix]|uniref:hypothetical protein n=1 Tax=Stenotrophomonas indicatrix TaxID=2045451 RepID=UPI00069E70A9|nr:hypothetical protein [Stenotrophomonas indicatrix]
MQLCATKAPEDLRNLVAARIAEHQQVEQQRLDDERARIRKEEGDRAARLQQENNAQAVRDTVATVAAATPAAAPAPVAGQVAAAPEPTPIQQVAAVAAAPAASPVVEDAAPWVPEGKKIKLGEINALIGPLTISADGLRQLGFEPVATERGAKLYAADQVPAMCEQMIRVLRGAANGHGYPLAA